jgi:hypothetical protein
MNGKVQGAIFGGVLATALVGGIGYSLATALPASAQVMGPAMRLAAPGGHFQRGVDSPQAPQLPGVATMGRGQAAMARPDIDGVIATVLGMTEDQIHQELATKSIADLLQANGGDLEAVKAAIIADGQAKLDAAVQAGTITADQATTMASTFASHLDAMVTEVHNQTGNRGHGMGLGGPLADQAGPVPGDQGGPRARMGRQGAAASTDQAAGDQSGPMARIGRQGAAGSAGQVAPVTGDAQASGPMMGDRGGRRGGPNGLRGQGVAPVGQAPVADATQS